MEQVGHQLLEAHVLDARHAFGAVEVLRRRIAAGLALARVVDQELGDLAQGAAFLAIVDDDAQPALLRHFHADLDAVREIGPAGADVGAEDVGAVALVVEAAGDLRLRLADLFHVAEEIDRGAADRRQEQFEVGTCDQLGVHAAGLLEERSAQIDLGHAEAFGDAGQPPHRLDRRLGDAHLAVGLEDVAIRLETPRRHGVLDLRHGDVRLGDGDGRADVPARLQLVGEHRGHEMAPGIERHDLPGIEPSLERANQLGRRGVGEIGPVIGLEFVRGDGERAVDAVAAGMHANGVALGRIGHSAHDRPADGRVARTPHYWRRLHAALGGVGIQSDVSHMLSGPRTAGKRGIV